MDNVSCCCGEKELLVLFKNQDYCLLQCNKCLLTQKYIDKFSREKVQEIQSKSYGDILRRTQFRNHQKKAKDRIDLLLNYKKEGKLLEIGCGTGEFLETAQNHGFEVMGIDSSEAYAAYIETKGLKVIGRRLEDAEIKGIKFDVIAMFHLLEHIEEPNIFLQQIYDCLQPGGILFIIVPNVESFTNNLFGYNNPDFQVPDHLYFYSRISLAALVNRVGFDILQMFTKEYPLNILSKTKRFIENKLNKNIKKINNTNLKAIDGKYNSTPAVKHIRQKVARYSYEITEILTYPVLKMYSTLIEKRMKGNELIMICSKP